MNYDRKVNIWRIITQLRECCVFGVTLAREVFCEKLLIGHTSFEKLLTEKRGRLAKVDESRDRLQISDPSDSIIGLAFRFTA